MNDPSLQKFNRLFQLLGCEAPSYVKEAAASKDFSPGKDWAHPCLSELPVTSPADTWMSAVYLYGADALGEKDEFFKVAEANIVAAASRHHCFADIMDVKAAAAVAKQPKALDDSDFAIIMKVAGAPQRRFPIHGAEALKKSAKVFHANRKQYSFPTRVKIAAKILEKSRQFNAELPGDVQGYLEKAACLYPTSPTELVQRLRVRSAFFEGGTEQAYKIVAEGAGETEKYAELAPVIAAMEEQDPMARRLVAEGTLPLPEEIFFRPAPVKAASANTVTLQNGDTFDVDAMAKAGSAPFAAAGDAYVDAVTGTDNLVDPSYVRAVAPTIPRDDAMILSDALKVAGVLPLGQTKEAKVRGPSQFSAEGMREYAERTGKKVDQGDFHFLLRVPSGNSKRAQMTTFAGIID